MELGYYIFVLGVTGILWNSKNILRILMSIEVMLLGIMLSVILIGIRLDDIKGIGIGIFILAIAAGESAIGLGLLVAYYRIRGNVSMKTLRMIKG